jgi:hypothetical protein
MIAARMMTAVGGMLLVLLGIVCVVYIALHTLFGISINDYTPSDKALTFWVIVGIAGAGSGFSILKSVHKAYKEDARTPVYKTDDKPATTRTTHGS